MEMSPVCEDTDSYSQRHTHTHISHNQSQRCSFNLFVSKLRKKSHFRCRDGTSANRVCVIEMMKKREA